MAEENTGMSPGIATDVIVEFDKSIRNIQAFGEQMSQLDARFGALDQRIDNMRNSLSSLSAQTSKASGRDLRKQIEQELNNIVAANGVVLSNIGSAPLKVKQETVRNLFRRVDAELNRAILRQIGNINVQIDPSFNTGAIPIGKDEFEQLNREIARLVKTQTKNLVDSIRKNGANLMSDEDIRGLQMNIGRGTVNSILGSIKEQLKPILMNPNVADVQLNFTKTDMNALLRKVKAQIKEALDIDLEGALGDKGNAGINRELAQTARKVDNIVEDYVKEVRRGITNINPASVEVPIKSLSKRLRRYVAQDMDVTEQQLERQLRTMDVGSAHGYELRRQFSSLERTINSKMTSGTSKMVTQLRQSVRAVEMEPSSSLKHYLIHELNKLNNEIVKKVRQQIDEQFRHMKAEIATVNTAPKSINRGGRIRSMADGYGRASGGRQVNQTVINNNYGERKPAYANTNAVNDPYARRDNYMNSFGIQGAVVNTLRHILAGGIVGAPMMAAYQAVDTFRGTQLEQLKIYQNYMMKDQYQTTDEDGNTVPDFSKVAQEVEKLVPTIKDMAGFYAVDYGEMSQVASVASRMTSSKEEANAFMDYSSMIYRLDNEGDLVETIAPGMEAIMGQFDRSVWEMDDVVKAFGVATNVSKATTDELMKVMQRGGSTFNSSNIDIDEATMLAASALQSTGLTGQNIGNMFRTFNTRLGMPSVQSKLQEYGIDVYEEDEYGRRMRRSGMDIYTDLGNMVASNRVGDEALDEILQASAGGYQIGKVRAFIESVNDLDVENEHGLNVHDMIENARGYNMDTMQTMLSNSMNSDIMRIDRAGTEMNVALTSIVESLSPTIADLADGVTNLSKWIQENSDITAQLVGVLGNTLVGAAAFYGGKKAMEYGGYQGHLSRVETYDNLWGGKGLSGRERQGTMEGMTGILGQRSNLLNGSTESKRFVEQALGNSVLAPYVQELASMDEKRKREINDYVQSTRGRNGSATDLADFFSIMDESRDFTRRPRMTADEMHRNSAFNARQLVNNKAMSNVFEGAFSESLVNTMSDRNQFLSFNSDQGNRKFTRSWARMGDTERNDFSRYLSDNYSGSTKTIKDMQELQQAFNGFNEEQSRMREEVRRQDPHFVGLNDNINNITNSMNKSNKAGDRYLNFLDRLGQKGRAALPTLLNIGKSIGRMGAQMMAFQLIGDTISGNASNIALNQTQQELRDRRTEMDAGQMYLDINRGGLNGENIWRSLTLGYNSVADWFQGGNQKVGVGDSLDFKNGFESWLQSEYGTRDFAKVEQEQGVSGEDLMAEYFGATGQEDELKELEKQDFMDEYREMTVDQAMKDQWRREAIAEREQANLEKWEKGEDMVMSVSDTIELLQSQLEDLRLDNSMELIEAQLNGVKSNSVELIRIRKQQIEEEQEVYERQIELSNKNIEDLRNQLDELESVGNKYTTDEEGNQVLTDEYRDTEDRLNKEQLRLDEVEKEFGEGYMNNELELAKLSFQEVKMPIDKFLEESSHNRQMSDLYANLGNAENSSSLYQERIMNAQQELNSMKQALSDYQAIDPELDVDGELKTVMRNLEQSILQQTIELKNLRLSKILSYREDLDEFNDNQDIDMLRKRVSMGGLDSNDPALQGFRISQLNKERNELEGHIANLRAALQNPNATADEQAKIQAEIRELTKQSLNAQLGIYQELKNSSGTFNLPEGVTVMSQYDYMAGQGTHSNMTFQSGDTYVSITLPNITDKSSSQQMADAGQQIGQGIAQGRINSYRSQLNASPYNYRTL